MVLFGHVSFEDPIGNPSGNVCQVIRHNFTAQARGCIEDIKLRVINRERERERDLMRSYRIRRERLLV